MIPGFGRSEVAIKFTQIDLIWFKLSCLIIKFHPQLDRGQV